MKPKDIKKLIKKEDRGYHHYAINFSRKPNQIKIWRDGKEVNDFSLDFWVKNELIQKRT